MVIKVFLEIVEPKELHAFKIAAHTKQPISITIRTAFLQLLMEYNSSIPITKRCHMLSWQWDRLFYQRKKLPTEKLWALQPHLDLLKLMDWEKCVIIKWPSRQLAMPNDVFSLKVEFRKEVLRAINNREGLTELLLKYECKVITMTHKVCDCKNGMANGSCLINNISILGQHVLD